MRENIDRNPLGSEKVSKLIGKFAVPSIIAMLVGAIYNIVDQFFIGQAVGTLGNAATNIAFPLATSCTALGLLFGIGGASSFNIAMGEKDEKRAAYYVGNSITMLLVTGTILCIVTLLFLKELLIFFGSPDEVLGYTMTYVKVTAFGFPFLIVTTGGGHLIRADGNPKMTMICSLSGAVINTVLDAVFVFGFQWGMFGAALATVIGQLFSGILVITYIRRYRTIPIQKKHFFVRWIYITRIMSLGMASFFNQIAMMIVQVVMNKSLTYYGALSEYGKAIPLACAGIVTKVNQIFFSIVIGIAQGTQPIESYNYGAKNYHRVKEAYRLAILASGVISIGSFLLFQTIPRQLISLFGKGDEVYYKFGVNYFRIFLFFTCLNFLQPITSTFFTSIGKAYKGIFLSLTRQILFLLPLIAILPLYLGIDGIMYAGPIADFIAAVVAIVMAGLEFKKIGRLERQLEL